MLKCLVVKTGSSCPPFAQLQTAPICGDTNSLLDSCPLAYVKELVVSVPTGQVSKL